MPLTQVRGGGIANDAVSATHIATGAVTVADIPNGEITGAKIEDDVALGGNPTTTTQTAGNNSTRIATTAFVTTAVGALSQDLISTDVTQSASRTFADNQNHAMVGPMTLNSGVVFTIGSGSKLVILN